jgi:hypothetical protein
LSKRSLAISLNMFSTMRLRRWALAEILAMIGCAAGGRRAVAVPALGELRDAEDIGDRRAELVAGEVDELAFDGVGLFEALEVVLELVGHGVEVAREAAELVVAEGGAASARLAEAVVAVAGLDVVDGVLELDQGRMISRRAMTSPPMKHPKMTAMPRPRIIQARR